MKSSRGYIRVSDKREQARGLGEEAQRLQIVEYCKKLGIEVEFITPDIGVSGGRPLARRRGGQELLDAIESGCRQVIVFKLDRLGRSVSDISRVLEEFRRKGVRLISVCENLDLDTLSGWALSQFLLVFAEWERRSGSERMKALHEVLKSQGRKRGHFAPYGWRAGPDGVLVEDSTEQRGLKYMRGLKTRGYSDRDIAKAMNERGFPSKGGKLWSHSAVKSVLERPKPERTKAAAPDDIVDEMPEAAHDPDVAGELPEDPPAEPPPAAS